ncbi:MAG: PACE efflux transporter [Alphaproteobacteria bacterium]|nr:PACE efflux transporter [Rhizobiaceae bacterium]MBU3961311.1 PACE efflux transporter [Alphaproteobacteria bacterium]MBU4052193.1 PACE efflux transporter [Alphaproteobacteria bacterium]MBU4087553.1 PACE efflux transporter [Alphaproteobacteria bacterium]MBU4157654.1 PACE efflux transporter [Alphaproteobacteria bacterium]
MRSTSDRIRHAISFEILALLLVTPLGAWVFSLPITDIGVVSVASATIAMLWNYVYNLGFDHAMQRFTGTTYKTVPIRVLHAVLFEAGILIVLAPFIAWYLGVGLWHAIVMDVSFSLFYLVYAFVFNWSYDRLFPIPEWQQPAN